MVASVKNAKPSAIDLYQAGEFLVQQKRHADHGSNCKRPIADKICRYMDFHQVAL
jgi:hypothetical protein